MFDRREIRHRAYLMGVDTGNMPNVDIIWAFQELEGSQACFGNGRHCSARHCRWRKSCLALDFHADHALPLAQNIQTIPLRKLLKRPTRCKPAGRPQTVSPPVETVETSSGLERHRQQRRRLNRLAPPNALPPLQTV